MNKPNFYLEIIVPSPLWQSFDYLPPAESDEFPTFTDWPAGIRISVPFGRRQVIGVLLNIKQTTNIAENKIKMASKRLDQQPLLTQSLLQLCQWVSEYYHYPLGEVVTHALPKWLRQDKPLPQAVDKPSALENAAQAHLPSFTAPRLELNSEQQHAVASITAATHSGFNVFLLDGITGSGKTEVYFHCIEQQLAAGKQALVLVPEIALTPQTVSRFQQRFQVPIVLLHSGLNDRERAVAWLQAGRGDADIIIGTRSAIFTPLARPGIIILDEEHDPSFKQQSGLRYSARDCAIMRARLENITIALGSATPSLESLYNCQRQRYQYLTLKQRAGNAQPPQIGLIDLRNQRLNNGLSKPLLDKVALHLNQGGQVLIFLNRRGYAPVLLCHKCGWMAQCSSCDARLTLHLASQRLFCHHCGAEKSVPPTCEQCQHNELIHVGQGTERIEQAIQEQFQQVNIVRIDRDSTRRKGAMQQLLNQMHTEEAHILIGTQMVAKGHHFAKLSLVAIIDADSGLFSSDFRALERMAQLLVQVAGRAGRSERSGEVVIQTHQPHHPVLQILLQHGYAEFAQALLRERQQAELPPFHYFALIRCDGKTRELTHQFLNSVKELFHPYRQLKVDVLGPIPATMERRADHYHAQLLMQSAQRQSLQRVLHHTVPKFNQCAGAQRVRWSLDVDPQEMY